MARLPSYISRVGDGAGVRYEARVNPPRSGGTRRQLKRRFAAVADAVDWHTRTTAEFGDGTYIAPSELTVNEACEQWLAAKALRLKPTTMDAYTAALAPVIERYGDRRVQSIAKADVEALVVELRDGSACRVPWQRTSINPMLARWRNVWTGLHAEGVLPRNVVALVEPLRKPAGAPVMKIDDALTEAEIELLITSHTPAAEKRHTRRREVLVHLALLGLRRGELAGLRWSAVDLDAETPTLTVCATRVSTSGGVVDQDDAKTVTSARTLPIPPHLVPILRRVRKEHREMRLKAGRLWQGGADGHVIAQELGRPLSPRTIDRWWEQAVAHAGLTHRRLHASRHTAATLLALRGAGPEVIAAWLGHADGGVLAMRVYVKKRAEMTIAAAALLDRSASGTGS
jgi:integrase